MSEIARLKREMLREAVRENLALIQGRPKGTPPRGRVTGRLSRAALLVVAPFLVLISIDAFSSRPSPPEVLVVERTPEEADPAASAGAASPGTRPGPHKIAASVFRLQAARIVVDPGHGGHDPGAKTPSGLLEKDVTLDVARHLARLLSEDRFDVRLTRSEDRFVSLRDRAAFANEARADLFVSIHVNSIPSSERRGVETYYLGATEDPTISHLATQENVGSGYALADFRRLLEGIYTEVRQDDSRRFAEVVQRGMWSSLRKANPVLEDRGVKQAPFVVLVGTEMPGILAEVSCISNEDEARLLSEPAYRESIARALFSGVSSYAGERNRAAGVSGTPVPEARRSDARVERNGS